MSVTVSANVKLPTTAEIKEAMITAGKTAEGAKYLCDQVSAIVERSKELRKSPAAKAMADNVVQALQTFSENVAFKFHASSNIWKGEHPPESAAQNMQSNIAIEAMKALSKKVSSVQLDYAISNEGHFIRGYSSNGEAVNEEVTGNLDKLLHGWLADNNTVISDGFLYDIKATEFGDNKIPATIVNALFDKVGGGLAEYMEARKIAVSSTHRDYPGQEQEKQDTKRVEDSIDAYKKAEVVEAPEPVEPSSGMGSGASN